MLGGQKNQTSRTPQYVCEFRARNFQRHKAVRVVLAVVLVFVACHLPYNITLLCQHVNMCSNGSVVLDNDLQVAKTVTQTIAYLHCCLNPVLYALVGVKFRNHFRRIMQDLWCLGKRYIAPRRFSRVTSEIYVSTRRSVDGSSENGSSFTIRSRRFQLLSVFGGLMELQRGDTTEEDTSVKRNKNMDLSEGEFGDYGPLVEPCSYQNNHRLEQVVGPYIHSIICILGFIGNSLVIVTYAFYKRTKSMTDVYLLNVAIADLLFAAVLPLIVYNELTSWSMGPVACKLLRGSYSVNLYSGMLLLACISGDRYIAIVQARRSFRLRSLPYSRVICAIVWIFAILLSIPTFYSYNWYEPSHNNLMLGSNMNYMFDGEGTNLTNFWDAFMLGGQENQTSRTPQYVCEFRFESNSTALSTKVAIPSTQLAVGFFLPLLIMISCYTAVIITLLRARNFQRHKAVRVVLAVVLVFIACHLPYNITLLYDTVNMFQQGECEVLDNLQVAKTVTQTIAYLHCCLNPVLYAFIGVKFRNHFRRIMQDLCVWGRDAAEGFSCCQCLEDSWSCSVVTPQKKIHQ
ncbi:C-C chemokine receptor type 6-like isoform X1 [Lates japonicus]|uniref:C-C chemokine receptor type 6-like isoform X1 n=1 Tax=Lates japonicus TaxID=270547 RepID=A0AAD3NCH9_LATJO|nr:C-C chemokine receptor type 6-like isoform X1 [Lates japonicus]